ncbi:hypothetical protein GDO86_003216 [Hymenochirus boettgeri]|uniref:Uncharacterized protein n=1 Tax=Hymenochirus boettgeri TaxID=247094 RepID=A0A8T2K2L1_9PIPI|nr:hypothetical protein GDO86_003216 [Hymenochirus boettgeri]
MAPVFILICISSVTILCCVTAENQTHSTISTLQKLSTNMNITEHAPSVSSTISILEATKNSSSSSSHETNTTTHSYITTVKPVTDSHTSKNGTVGLTNFTTTITPLLSTVNISITNYTDLINTTLSTSGPTHESSTLQNYTEEVTSHKGASENTTTSSYGGRFSNLNSSETILTSIFSALLGIVTFAILAFALRKYWKRRSQYCHHPLNESTCDSGDRYSAPDDTLVISGGLYDGPRIYNPTITVLEEEESQHDFVSFSTRPGQFRLEFLPGDKEMNSTVVSSSFNQFTSRQRNV